MNTYGPSPASTISKRTNIKRGSIYDVLNNLVEKNVIVSYQEGVHTYFSIDDIEKLVQQEKEKVTVASQAVTILQSLQQTQETIDVQYYNGKEGYHQMYEDILKANPEELLVWINLDEFHAALDPVYEENWTLKRIKKNIKARLMIQNTEYAKAFKDKDKQLFRETRLLQKALFDSTCILYSNYITLFDSTENFTGIRIHHKNFSTMFQALFEEHWNSLSDQNIKNRK